MESTGIEGIEGMVPVPGTDHEDSLRKLLQILLALLHACTSVDIFQHSVFQ